jgi:plasmid stabilization system protein ParE
MSYAVVFSPEAEEQLVALYRYIAAAASPDVASRYTEAIVAYGESLHMLPLPFLQSTKGETDDKQTHSGALVSRHRPSHKLRL